MTARRPTLRHWLLAFVALAALVAFVLWPGGDSLRVPLGVEQAAIVTYSGPLLEVAPYKWGVAVNVRMAEVRELPDRRVYDLRYIVNRAGTFDLRDYLVAADGSSLAGLPAFRFEGDARLSRDLDTRIQETEELRLDVGGRYPEILTVLTLLWLGWLWLLIFWKRPKPPAAPEAGPQTPTFAEMMTGFLAQLEAGTLSAEAKARMEMALLRRWRDELALAGEPMHRSLDEIARDDRTGETWNKLQHWLHHPSPSVTDSELASLLKPHALNPAP
jgi:hypothetical protein